MKAADLLRFAEDLGRLAGLAVRLELSDDPEGLHVLRVNGVDFFFIAQGGGYDGWGKMIVPPTPK